MRRCRCSLPALVALLLLSSGHISALLLGGIETPPRVLRTLHQSSQGSNTNDPVETAAAKRSRHLRELTTSDLLLRQRDGDGLETADEVLQQVFKFEFAPAMTVEKYQRMTARRVEVAIQCKQ
jgi:hypothetical protein